jgi:hypothetical protein
MKICIEKIMTEQTCWIPFPNGDLSAAINDFTEGDPYKVCAVIYNDETISFPNIFHRCSEYKLNALITELEENHHFDSNDLKNLSTLNLLLEDRNYNVDEVADILFSDRYKIFHVKNMGEVAKEYLEETSDWYHEAKKAFPQFNRYFDFNLYGERLRLTGNFLQDKSNEIIIEIFE